MNVAVSAQLPVVGFVARRDGLHPAARLAAALICAVPAAILHDLAAAAGALAWGMVLVALSGLPLKVLARRLLALELLTLAGAGFLPFTMGGDAVAVWGAALSIEGMQRAALLLLKTAAAAASASALLAGTRPADLGRGLACLGAPRAFVGLFLMCARYVDVLAEQYAQMRLAMRARAFRPRASRHCWRSYGMLVGMLAVNALGRAENIHAAMRCRGWRGAWPLPECKPAGAADWALVGINAVVAALLMIVGAL